MIRDLLRRVLGWAGRACLTGPERHNERLTDALIRIANLTSGHAPHDPDRIHQIAREALTERRR
jgi:hypothetical protein